MRFVATPIAGAFLVEPDRIEDERGFFARTFCRDEFAAHGLNSSLVQCSISFNRHKGTVRGMHYQKRPHEEAKLVRCTQGAIYDVLADIRADSPTYRCWHGIRLTAESRCGIYIPEGVAHGFQTLCNDTEVFYQMSEFYQPALSAGFCWNDPTFDIVWPEPINMISARDMSYPALSGS